MKSIPTIFVKDKETRLVTPNPLRMVDWVFTGKGIATRKWEGVAIKVENGKVYRRFEWKTGDGVPPTGFIKLSEADPKRPYVPIPGWVPVRSDFLKDPQGRDERALKQAWDDKLRQLTQAMWAEYDAKVKGTGVNPYSTDERPIATVVPNGTYELCGPDVHGNHEKLSSHVLYKHGEYIVTGVPRTFEKLRIFLAKFEGEGIVWHYHMKSAGGYENILMAKIKRKDFGFIGRSEVKLEDLQVTTK